MLIIPMTNKINWRNPPVVTIILILLNVCIYFVFQKDDHQTYADAQKYYFKSGLAEIEVPLYMSYLQSKGDNLPENYKRLKPEILYEYHFKMEQDFEFIVQLENDQIIQNSDPKFGAWKEKRIDYKRIRAKSVAYSYGFKPAYFEVLTLFTSIFLHGSFGHLLGNMIFLWIVGCILEAGCGGYRYAIAYIITGVCATLFFKLIYYDSTIPLVGASGAISGLMGMQAVLFGKKTIRVFYSLGFFFNYIKIRAFFLLLFWVGNELIQLFFGQASNIAYVAHIGGLLSGGLCAFILSKIPKAVDHDIFEDEKEDIISPMLEKALEKTAQFDFTGAIAILREALKNDPENPQVLEQLFKVHKQTPEKREFHVITEKLISVLIKNRSGYIQASELFKEYQKTAKRIKLSYKILVRMCFVWCELEEPNKAGKMIMNLIRMNKNLPGLSAALLKTSFAFRKKGEIKNCEKCQTYIVSQFPKSQEASLVLESSTKS